MQKSTRQSLMFSAVQSKYKELLPEKEDFKETQKVRKFVFISFY